MKRIPLSLELATRIQNEVALGTFDPKESRNQVVLGKLPANILTALNTPDLELVTSIAIIEKMIFDHGLTPVTIASLHELICAPLEIYKSASQDGSVVVLTMKVTRNLPVIAAVKLDKPDSFMKSNIHWLASAYPKDQQEMLGVWKRSGLLIWG